MILSRGEGKALTLQRCQRRQRSGTLGPGLALVLPPNRPLLIVCLTVVAPKAPARRVVRRLLSVHIGVVLHRVPSLRSNASGQGREREGGGEEREKNR